MLTHALLLDLAEELFKAAFEQPRTPRSDVYKRGVMAALINQAVGTPVRDNCPYQELVELDAFYAGVSEGYAIWTEYTKTTRRAS